MEKMYSGMEQCCIFESLTRKKLFVIESKHTFCPHSNKIPINVKFNIMYL